MTLEERIKELAFERGCGIFLTDIGDLSFREQYDLIIAAEERSDYGLPDIIDVWEKFENETPAELLELIDIEIASREDEYRRVAKWGRIPQNVEQGKETLGWLKENGVKLLSLDRLRENLIGETIDCDVLLQSLLWAGYSAVYENIISNSGGFFALFYVDGTVIGAVDSFSVEHIVRAWKPEMIKPRPLIIEKV